MRASAIGSGTATGRGCVLLCSADEALTTESSTAMKKAPEGAFFTGVLAEQAGFEPAVGY
jgi:hypothetical protein